MNDTSSAAQEAHTFLFVAGLHRSGTTLLAKVLSEHPDISGLSGTGTFMNEGAPLLKRIPHRHGVGAMAFKPGSHLTERSRFATPEIRDHVWQTWSPFWDTRKHFLLEKSPSHLLRLRLFQSLFPKSKIIVILRHPIAQSMAISKWALGRKLLQHLLNWHLCHEILLRDLRHLENVHFVSFENLCSSPDTEMDRLFAFIGIPRNGVRTPAMTASNEKYYEMWETERKSPWDLTRKRIIRAAFGHRLGLFGYSYAPPYDADIQRIQGLTSRKRSEDHETRVVPSGKP